MDLAWRAALRSERQKVDQLGGQAVRNRKVAHRAPRPRRGGGQYPVLRLERTIPASPHRVYRAWLEPDLLRCWMAPGTLEATQVEIDERVGGHYRIWHAESGAATMLTLVHERLDSLAAALPPVAENVGPGWEDVLPKLEATLGAAGAEA